jgi:chromosome segregation ATPase
LKVRCNELNAIVLSGEKKLNKLKEELLNEKLSHQQLQEEFGKRQKDIKQLFSQCSDYRVQKDKLNTKYGKLKDAYDVSSNSVSRVDA